MNCKKIKKKASKMHHRCIIMVNVSGRSSGMVQSMMREMPENRESHIDGKEE